MQHLIPLLTLSLAISGVVARSGLEFSITNAPRSPPLTNTMLALKPRAEPSFEMQVVLVGPSP